MTRRRTFRSSERVAIRASGATTANAKANRIYQLIAMAARSVLGLNVMFAFCRIYQDQHLAQEQVAAHVTDLLLRGLAA